MPIRLTEKLGGKIFEIRVNGTLAHDDYQVFTRDLDRLIRAHGKIRILFEMMADFQGWTSQAAWDDAKLAIKHFSDIERLAMVGDKKWEKGMSVFFKPFTAGKIRYFDRAQAAEALAWVEEADHLAPVGTH